VQDSVNNPNENTAIRFPECPRCKQKIRRCTRYTRIINQVNKLIDQVKKKILGNHSEQDINERRKLLIKEFEQTETKLKEINLGQLKDFFARLYNPDNLFTDDILNLMKNILLFLNEIDKFLIDGRNKLPLHIFEDLVNLKLHHFFFDKRFILYRSFYH
jgi:sugar-specific transcriptional regulator TrmB